MNTWTRMSSIHSPPKDLTQDVMYILLVSMSATDTMFLGNFFKAGGMLAIVNSGCGAGTQQATRNGGTAGVVTDGAVEAGHGQGGQAWSCGRSGRVDSRSGQATCERETAHRERRVAKHQ